MTYRVEFQTSVNGNQQIEVRSVQRRTEGATLSLSAGLTSKSPSSKMSRNALG